MSDPSATPPIDVLLRHREWLRRLAASLVVDEARADDLVQKTLLAALERPPAHASHPRAWLATVARRLSRGDDARELRQFETERRGARPEAQAPADAVVAEAALQHEMSAAVLALEEPYRTAILLRFSSNLSPRAIAKRTGAPVETVRTRIKRGLELLRAELVRRRGEAARGAGRPEATREWAVALIGLLDSGMRRAVRRAILAKSTGAAAGAGVTGATLASVVGVLGMSTQVKLVAAVLLVAGGTFAVVKLAESPKLPPRDPVAQAARGTSEDAAAKRTVAPELAPPAEATRAPESHEPVNEGAAPAAAAPAGILEGIVLTSRGEPAAGATVLVEDAGRHGDFGTLDELCSNAERLLGEPVKPHGGRQRLVAETSGNFRFAELAPGGAVNVAAIDAKGGTALKSGVVVLREGAPTRVELRLVEGVVLHGTVTDDQGLPIAKADVSLNRFARVGNGTTSSSLLSLATGADGRYRTISLPFRGFQIGASAEGFLRSSLEPIELLESEHDRVVDIRLSRAVTLRGRLLGADGTPAGLAHAGSETWIAWSEEDPRSEGESVERLSGQRGKLDRAADRYEATPSRKGARFISAWAGDALLGASAISDAGVGPDVVVELSKVPAPTPKGTLAIEVVAAGDLTPVPWFHAEVRPDPTGVRDPRAFHETREGESAKGRLEIADLPLGRYDLSIRAKGFVARFVVAQVTAASTATRIEVRPATAFVTGRVEDENGRPVAGAKLFLLGSDGRVASPWPECTCASDAEGGFLFKGVAEGSCSVVAEADGFAPAAAATTASEKGDAARAGVVLTLRGGVTVQIQPRCRGLEITGPFIYRIRDEHGAPVIDHHRCPGFLTTVSGGGASPFRLAPARYTVEVFCPKFAPATASFSATEGKVVEVELTPLEEPAAGR